MVSQSSRNYDKYATIYRKIFNTTDNRKILEAFWRGIKAETGGRPGIVLSPPGAKPDWTQYDVAFRVDYGPQRFCAVAPSSYLVTAAAEWLDFVGAIETAKSPKAPSALTHDFAMYFIGTMITDNRHYEDNVGTLIACALAWLLHDRGSYRQALYEIVDNDPGAWDFLLTLDGVRQFDGARP